jgi:hypothetical protein
VREFNEPSSCLSKFTLGFLSTVFQGLLYFYSLSCHADSRLHSMMLSCCTSLLGVVFLITPYAMAAHSIAVLGEVGCDPPELPKALSNPCAVLFTTLTEHFNGSIGHIPHECDSHSGSYLIFKYAPHCSVALSCSKTAHVLPSNLGDLAKQMATHCEGGKKLESYSMFSDIVFGRLCVVQAGQ